MKATGNSVFLDTSIIVDIFGGQKNLVGKIQRFQQLYINSIVFGELHVGINRVTNKRKHRKILNEFADLCVILPVDEETSIIYGEITAQLYKVGKPIPTNDIWIAASALQYQLPLATKDSHFKEIQGLALIF